MSNERAGDAIAATSREFASGQKVFGRYTLIKVIGRGGMGIVWLARDEELERNVALKFLPDLMIQDRSMFDQLKRETKRCLELTHPHIVRIHDFIHDQRSGCISMEYIDGETLSNLRAEKPQRVFEPDEIAQWIAQLCDALDYAHTRANVIHCDLKPPNLMVNQRGHLKITDFGIARTVNDSVSRLTAEQGRSGTLVYMSPQQLNGERCTHVDDIYSLGASIYELLTSKPPFYSGNIDRQICERVAPSMTDRRKELDIEPAAVPKAWEETVAACLAKDPSRRPPSANEVAQRLQLPIRQASLVGASTTISKKKTLVIGGVAALLLLSLVGFYVGSIRKPNNAGVQPAAIPEKSIAVLPFENRSEDKTNAYFAEGIQDEILTRLSKIADLKVISRTSTQHYQSAPENLSEIAKQLGVAHVLEGSVQKSGNAVRVNVQLIKAANDSHLWADTFDRKLIDTFSVETEVAKSIADQLKVKLTGLEEQAITAKPTDNAEAYDAYLRGLAYTLKPVVTPASALGAQKYLKQAAALDPNFALAWALLSYVDALGYVSTALQPTIALREEARQAAERALALQPNLGEGLLAKGYYYYACLKRYDEAVSYFERARQSLPNSSRVAEFLAYVSRRQGQWQRSESEFNEAEKLDPRDVTLLAQHGFLYIALRRFSDAERKFDQVLNLNPDDVDTLAIRAAIAQARGDLARASSILQPLDPAAGQSTALKIKTYQQILERRPAAMIVRLKEILTKPDPALGYVNGELRFWLGWAQAVAGDTAAARESWLQARTELEPFHDEQKQNASLICDLALIDARLGDDRTALKLLEDAMTALSIENDAIDGPALLDGLSRVAAQVGQTDRAIAGLQTLLRTNYSGLLIMPLTPALLRLDPTFDPLRKDSRFKQLAGPTEAGTN